MEQPETAVQTAGPGKDRDVSYEAPCRSDEPSIRREAADF